MFRIYANEEFREIETDFPLKFRYAVSNKGRLISFTENFNDGNLLKGSMSDGYKTFRYGKSPNGKSAYKTLFVYKLVAEFFIPKTSEEQQFVLHLDYVRDNDLVKNLKWATYDEKLEHYKKSPHVIKSKQKLIEHNIKADGRKLTSTNVMRLKKLLNKPNQNTRIKILAKQFGISEMQVNRIKRGENWAHIKV
ncbi:NUMOD4 domain-containing protein [Flavobacterium wongokense]|uniref:NUMOD4 domain-containing protein n=1 Tax=Flavobacterium wongokense TaxID=2910674 RepID=UPI001F2E99B3|nr:NUMOD4 domain-containing protein [Flavobacterium sp. WG47]MCF6131181.1 NUMOD4 domain-containing protein [Flavobacterium sp. WG47]